MNTIEPSKRLREFMDIFGLKQQDIINKTGISSSCLSSYLSGKRSPKSDKIGIIAEAYNVSPTWLMGYDVPMRDNVVNDAILDAKIIKDNEVREMLVKYYSLSPEKQSLIRNIVKEM